MLLIFRVCEVLEASLVAQMPGVSRQAASTMLATMQRDGLIERADPAAADARTIPLRLTAAGQALPEEAIGDALAGIAAWSSRFTPDERAVLDSGCTP